MGKGKYIIATIIALLLLGVFTLAAIGKNAPRDRVFHVRVAEQDFWIPGVYFTRYFPEKLDERDFSISVLYPDFQPTWKVRHKLKEWGKRFDTISISVGVNKGLNAEEYFKSIKESYDINQYVGQSNGMAFYKTPLNSKKSKEELYQDMDSNKKLSGFILCDPDDPQWNPHCNARYWSDSYCMEINFDKDMLSDWPNIKQKIFSLLDGFKIKPKGAN